MKKTIFIILISLLIIGNTKAQTNGKSLMEVDYESLVSKADLKKRRLNAYFPFTSVMSRWMYESPTNKTVFEVIFVAISKFIFDTCMLAIMQN